MSSYLLSTAWMSRRNRPPDAQGRRYSSSSSPFEPRTSPWGCTTLSSSMASVRFFEYLPNLSAIRSVSISTTLSGSKVEVSSGCVLRARRCKRWTNALPACRPLSLLSRSRGRSLSGERTLATVSAFIASAIFEVRHSLVGPQQRSARFTLRADDLPLLVTFRLARSDCESYLLPHKKIMLD